MPAAGASQKGLAQWLQRQWQRGWLFALVLIAATLAAYQSIAHAGFLWDDSALLGANDLIRSPQGWWQVWTERRLDYLPATSLTFWLEWRIWGMNAVGYHLDNVILHGLAAGLIWRTLRRLKVDGSRLAAAIFALHPVNVASVAWIAERKNTLTMCFLPPAALVPAV